MMDFDDLDQWFLYCSSSNNNFFIAISTSFQILRGLKLPVPCISEAISEATGAELLSMLYQPNYAVYVNKDVYIS